MEASSVSNNPILTKVLIDLSEYRLLLKAKEFQDNYEKNLSEHYANKDKNSVTELAQPQKSDLKGQDIQIGAGALSDVLSELKEHMLKCVKDTVNEVLKERLPSTFTGAGNIASQTVPVPVSNDLAPHVPEPAPLLNQQRLSGLTDYQKSDQNSVQETDLLLQKVPLKFRTKAAKLLEAIDHNATVITWNDNGVLFLDNDSIPHSNMFVLLPELYKKRPKRDLPGFIELVQKLAALGLGDLIDKSILRGMLRAKPIENHKELYDYIHQKPNKWYYIGP
jgi:hypothetical protein